jgi:hypothetical protein
MKFCPSDPPVSKKPVACYRISLLRRRDEYAARVIQRQYLQMRTELVWSFAEILMTDAAEQDARGAVAVEAGTVEERFTEQAEKWGRETSHLSSPNQKMLHPSYQAILGMAGEHKEEVIDLLLADLKDNRRPWFWALSYLTQTNPITPDDAGRIDRMINAWVRWGEARTRV